MTKIIILVAARLLLFKNHNGIRCMKTCFQFITLNPVSDNVSYT